MADNNTSKFRTGILLGVALVAIVLVAGYFLFPQLITKITGLVVGLFAVVGGMLFRRKK